MKNLKILIYLSCFLTQILYSQQEDKKENLYKNNQQIEETQDESDLKQRQVKYKEKWTKIEGILKYRLEIVDLNNQIVFSKETEDSELIIELLPGKYRKRLGLINKFNQLFLWTDWKEFEIKEIPTPKVSYLEKKIMTSNINEEKIQISLDGIVDNTKIYLEDPKNKEVKEILFKQIDTNRVELKIQPSKLGKGNYNLIIKNSEKKQTKILNAFEIQSAPEERKKVFNWKLLIPGVPQKERKEYYKGNFLQYGFLASLGISAYSYTNANRIEKKYSFLTKNFYLFNISGLSKFPLFKTSYGILLNYQTIQKIYKYQKEYQSFSNVHIISSLFAGTIYSIHLIDIAKYDFFIEPDQKKLGLSITFYFD